MSNKLIILTSIFILISATTLIPIVNAEPFNNVNMKQKYAHQLTQYYEKHFIPRYEQYVLNHVDKDTLKIIQDNLTLQFSSLIDSDITDDMEIVIYILTLIITFFYVLFGSNGLSFSLCTLTTVIVFFIPVTITAILLSIVETGAVLATFALGIFDAETIDDLIHMYGLVGCLFWFIIIAPIFTLLYLLSIPIVTVMNMLLFYNYLLDYINDEFPLP
jgi:hypothetical protein